MVDPAFHFQYTSEANTLFPCFRGRPRLSRKGAFKHSRQKTDVLNYRLQITAQITFQITEPKNHKKNVTIAFLDPVMLADEK